MRDEDLPLNFDQFHCRVVSNSLSLFVLNPQGYRTSSEIYNFNTNFPFLTVDFAFCTFQESSRSGLRIPVAVATRAWLTALCATTRIELPSLSRMVLQQV